MFVDFLMFCRIFASFTPFKMALVIRSNTIFLIGKGMIHIFEHVLFFVRQLFIRKSNFKIFLWTIHNGGHESFEKGRRPLSLKTESWSPSLATIFAFCFHLFVLFD